MIHHICRLFEGRRFIAEKKVIAGIGRQLLSATLLIAFSTSLYSAEGLTREESLLKEQELKTRLAEYQRVVVAEPFINIHTGAGRGYPIFHIVEQKESLWIVRRKYNWFHVISKEGKEGWITLDAILKTKNPDGTDVEFTTYNERDFAERDLEIGFRVGDFGGANVLGVSGAWQFTQNLAGEIVIGQGIGDFSEVRQTTVNVTNSPFPEWKYSPYFGIGGGVVKVIPSAAIVQEVDRSDETVFVTGGLKSYISDKFLFRFEYRNYAILTTQETNERIEEWTIGFSVFF
ncbi:SH3 domain-containing protein [Pleionea sediminis]|uniref:SH3 domain-containing protein n=1 Tax=Pleionea sediminis TaxID=2569479 RepID=UPI001184B3C9|nr:hypothetical protein [Pleionea sediminis]